MALFVEFRVPATAVEYAGKTYGGLEFHCNGGKFNFHPVYADKAVANLQADGHELEAIRESFTGIPFSKVNRVQVWTGDMAQFIFDNLPR